MQLRESAFGIHQSSINPARRIGRAYRGRSGVARKSITRSRHGSRVASKPPPMQLTAIHGRPKEREGTLVVPCALAILLGIQTITSLGIASRSAPHCDELAHLAAGLYHWQSGRWDAYRVNPPLVRLWATLPLALQHPCIHWSIPRHDAGRRLEWEFAQDLARDLSLKELIRALYVSRLMCVPFLWLGTLGCYCWAHSLHGPRSGLVAATLWSFCPNVLAWGSALGPDIPASALGLWAAFTSAIWLERRTWTHGWVAGTALGVAVLAKSTCFAFLILVVLIAAIAPWVETRTAKRQRHSSETLMQNAGPWRNAIPIDGGAVNEPGRPTGVRQLPVLRGFLRNFVCAAVNSPQRMIRRSSPYWILQVLFVGILAVITINLGYGSSGTGTRLGQFTFRSRVLTGESNTSNRFVGTVFEHVPVPFPQDFVLGLDQQKADFDEGKRSYLAGDWKDRGWWHYYLIGALVKLPLGFWGLFALMGVDFGYSKHKSQSDRCRSPRPASTFLLALPILGVIAVGTLVSSQTGFSGHFRYVFPCLPLLYVRVSRCVHEGSPLLTQVASLAMLIWFSFSSLSTWPLQHSYFNELAGGPRGGYRILLDSNLDWGQDVLRAHAWTQNHAQAQPVFRVFINDEFARLLPSGWQPGPLPPQPGWYLASIHRVLDPQDDFHFLHQLAPCDQIGYSTWVYHLTSDQLNRLTLSAFHRPRSSGGRE